jgi:hypothetical protein
MFAMLGVVVAGELANAFVLRRLPGWVCPEFVRVIQGRTSSYKIM